jgi:RimJ/RimL family protein N-acetyltransferase
VGSFAEDLPLEGEGFRLRGALPGDAAALAAVRSDPDVLRWVDPSACSVEQAEGIIRSAAEAWADGSSALFSIVSTEGELLGTLSLTFYGPRRASIGFDLDPAARGRGVATAAVELVSAWAFERFSPLARLELWILPGNERSIRVAERAGYQREGVLRSRFPFGDAVRDVVVFSLVRDDPRPERGQARARNARGQAEA